MKNVPFTRVAASIIAFFVSFGFVSFANPGGGEWKQGLVIEEFPRHPDQTCSDQSFIEPKKFGEPIGHTYLTTTLNGWKHTTDRNAIARGFLTVLKSGDYQFLTNSFYDRNLLRVAGETVCEYRDGASRVNTVFLKKGRVPIESVGFVNGRGATQGIEVKWKPPGQRELGPIPDEVLIHQFQPGVVSRGSISNPASSTSSRYVDPNLRAKRLTVVAKDFVVEIYKNGRRLPRSSRKLLLDRFGASVERIETDVKSGDWLVFHVVHNRLRHGGSKFFAVTGQLDGGKTGFVSRADSPQWAVCDNAAQSTNFIHFRESGTEARAMQIAKPWEEGVKFMKRYTDQTEFSGDAIWGAAPSTWIKYIVPEKLESIQKPGIESPSKRESFPRGLEI